jgi:glycosyltransferase involved in cell wall biosynthesis
MKSITFVIGSSLKNNQRTVLLNFGRLLYKFYQLNLVVSHVQEVSTLDKYFSIYRFSKSLFNTWDMLSCLKAATVATKIVRTDLVINVSHPFPLGFAIVLLSNIYKTPTVLRMTGDPFSERELYNNLIVRMRKKIVHEFFLGRLIYSKATLILPVGNNLAKILKKIGIDSNRIHVRPQPFDARPFQPVAEAEKLKMRERLGLDPNRRTVLFVGSLTWGKGIDRLATIIKLIESRSDDFQFCVLGTGPAVHYIESIKSQWIKLPGNVSREEVIKYFRAADVLIHPTRRDALPNVILEAIASGIPVIASPVGEIPHYVSNIAETEEQFVELLLSDQLVIDSLPSDMDWEKQKEDYLKLFNLAIVRGSKISQERETVTKDKGRNG